MSLVAVIKMKVPEAIWEGSSNTPLSARQILHRIRPQGGGDADNLDRILQLMRAWQLTVEDPTTEPFKKANGEGVLSYYDRRADARDLLGEAMQGMSIPFMREMLEQYDGFEGVETLVDVGGNAGVCLQMIMSKFPSVRIAINFDLPHSVVSASKIPGVTHVGGSAFELRCPFSLHWLRNCN
ncbi:hypothetical protein RJT34_19311 [Clitoria ternatea]|uniref:O-methyltransferase C-terminal domain-containing protein n=1 Tax=Clitoria ternatea TaxID=43366 RepID=A0AAN9IQZ8_CLITE